MTAIFRKVWTMEDKETVWMREGSMEQHLMSVSLVNIDEGELNDQETITTL